jgi:hypothetical protein
MRSGALFRNQEAPSMAKKLYQCTNPACSLGTVGAPGHFTGGITKEQVTILTGNPEPKEHGEGVCPNCAQPGKEVS